jgi:hypothetical protein|tara:strand:- start:776 stop:1003 length:228 start_codon:yes stop_codon:yes gene_type:complete
MSTAIIAKSEMRKNDNIIIGYGELPAIEIGGVQGWGVPGGLVTFSEEIAISWAIKLDKQIRELPDFHPDKLLKSS